MSCETVEKRVDLAGKAMTILVVTQHFPPEKGAVRRLFEFARYFVKQGHRVLVLSTSLL